jgi:hypothetical protein
VEAKLLQTAASLHTFFVLVMSAETLESLSRFLGIFERRMQDLVQDPLFHAGMSRAIDS